MVYHRLLIQFSVLYGRALLCIRSIYDTNEPNDFWNIIHSPQYVSETDPLGCLPAVCSSLLPCQQNVNILPGMLTRCLVIYSFPQLILLLEVLIGLRSSHYSCTWKSPVHSGRLLLLSWQKEVPECPSFPLIFLP